MPASLSLEDLSVWWRQKNKNWCILLRWAQPHNLVRGQSSRAWRGLRNEDIRVSLTEHGADQMGVGHSSTTSLRLGLLCLLPTCLGPLTAG